MGTLKRLQERLDQVQSHLESEQFLNSDGLGNEIGFWIFDYPAEHELIIRDQISHITERMNKRGASFLHLNLFQVLIDMLDNRDLYERVCQREMEVGPEGIRQSLKGPLSQDKVANFIADTYQPTQYGFLMLSGVGSTWPLIRSHELLSALQDIMGKTPLVLFYPGNYSGYDLHPFGLIESKNYYRAFKLIP